MHALQPALENLKKLNDCLSTHFIGRKIVWYKSVSSTQEIATSIASKGVADSNGTVIVADTQRNGRGRRGNEWISPYGGIWLSILLAPEINLDKWTLLPFATSLAVCEAINKSTGLSSKVKWPNDVLINEKKVSGILVDMSTDSRTIQYAIAGIGVNANINTCDISESRSFSGSYGITSLQKELSGLKLDRIQLIKYILEEFEEHYIFLAREDRHKIIEMWKAKSQPLISKLIQIVDGNKTYLGRVIDIEPDGALLVMKNDQIERIVSGDIVIRPVQ